MRLIFTNLVSNACKYSPYGGNLKISFKVSKNKRQLRFRVEDQGIGMSQDDINQIFFRFYRGQNVGSIEGTGIGLAIVKRAVDSLEGKIELESKVGEGTCFEVQIPVYF